MVPSEDPRCSILTFVRLYLGGNLSRAIASYVIAKEVGPMTPSHAANLRQWWKLRKESSVPCGHPKLAKLDGQDRGMDDFACCTCGDVVNRKKVPKGAGK